MLFNLKLDYLLKKVKSDIIFFMKLYFPA